MNLPNLLNIALGAIGGEGVAWRRFESRTQNSRGQWITNYEPETSIIGSWQAVDSRRIKELELDTSKTYRNLYTSNAVDHVNRGESPDMIIANGKQYEVVGNTDWLIENGWRGLLCVEIGNESENP